jgi:hypothetical protein
MYHLRQHDRQQALEAIAAFDTTAARFQVPGDRELVDQIKAAVDSSRWDEAMEAVRAKLLRNFQDGVDDLAGSSERTEAFLSDFFGKGPESK